MRKRIKELLIGLLTVTTVLSYAHVTVMAAPRVTMPLTGYEAPEKTAVEVKRLPGANSYTHRVSASTSVWSQYSSDYFYNQMNSREQRLYAGLTASAQEIMDSSDYADRISADYAGLSAENAMQVAQVWMQTEAQYFFMTNRVGASYSGNDGTAYIPVMTRYQDGSARQSARQTFISTINDLLSQASAGSTMVQKEKIIHDALVNRLTWDSSNESEKQGSASSLIGNSTVCAGYSAAFSILMNALGAPTISITSSNHEWNEINLGGTWYAVDVTWDDPMYNGMGNSFTDGTNLQDTYFNVSDRTLQSSSQGGDSHIPDSLWDQYNRPVCSVDGGMSVNDSSDAPVTPTVPSTSDNTQPVTPPTNENTQPVTPPSNDNTQPQIPTDDTDDGDDDDDWYDDDDTPYVSADERAEVTALTKSLSAKKGRTKKVRLRLNDAVDSVRYKSSKKKVATVSKNGTVRFKKKGTATITATVIFIDDSRKTIKIKVRCR